jgi:glucosamine-6-phosphate deaminase
MEVVIKSDRKQASVLGAKIVAQQIRNKKNSVLGLATGSTPLELYKELIRMHRDEGLDFSQVTCFNLDEYVGLDPSHPSSYHYFMWENLFKHINIAKDSVYIPDGMTSNIPQHCKDYEQWISSKGGIDLQILGLGTDGHIGFNEPISSLSSRTRIKTLTGQTLQYNRKYFAPEENMPRHVITMGIGTILEAKKCLLLAFGEAKASAVAAMVEGPLAAAVPASVLQMHPSTIVLLDKEASSKLKRVDYYTSVYELKPEWQRFE